MPTMTPHDRKHEWEAYDALNMINQDSDASIWSDIPMPDLIPGLQLLHDSLGWNFRVTSTGKDTRRRRLHTVCARHMGGLVGFLSNDSYQALFSGDTQEDAQRKMLKNMMGGCSAYATFGDAGRAKWEIPPFYTVEELKMKASISGSNAPWLTQFHQRRYLDSHQETRSF